MDQWSGGGTLSGKSAQIHKSLQTTLRNIVRPKDVIQKLTTAEDAVVEKDFAGDVDQPGLGTAMGLSRFLDKSTPAPKAKTENFPNSPSTVKKTEQGSVVEGLSIEKVLKEAGYDKLPMSEKGKEILEQIISRGGKPATDYSGKLLVEHGLPESAPPLVRPSGLKVGDRVIVLPWVSMGVHGATFDLPYVPETAKVTKMYVAPATVTKDTYPPGRVPRDLSKVETVKEDRLWGLELESENVKKDDDGLGCCPMGMREPAMVLRLEPLASPSGEVAPSEKPNE
jgi:hypothetical protein